MSKEQTPIERLKEEIERSEILSDDTKRILSLIDWNRKIQEEEEFTNAKVLEVLERDLKDLSDCYKAHVEDNPRKEVCQVLHTLIMEKQEQIVQMKHK